MRRAFCSPRSIRCTLQEAVWAFVSEIGEQFGAFALLLALAGAVAAWRRDWRTALFLCIACTAALLFSVTYPNEADIGRYRMLALWLAVPLVGSLSPEPGRGASPHAALRVVLAAFLFAGALLSLVAHRGFFERPPRRRRTLGDRRRSSVRSAGRRHRRRRLDRCDVVGVRRIRRQIVARTDRRLRLGQRRHGKLPSLGERAPRLRSHRPARRGIAAGCVAADTSRRLPRAFANRTIGIARSGFKNNHPTIEFGPSNVSIQRSRQGHPIVVHATLQEEPAP